ncbi:hypothetical protein D1816_17955 [Aquimarina sp. AD10]|uniref:hypothetical protein n=1 Tax=Aquimarina sp. AD10 TaxID=1714849 RepID=UPI000E48A758|nr:hypothetical protein [Aquimarina sp. AD10]AXT62162.1 hypothetical protein D1816_17955 [Aquimarina sp. AD10]RKM90643.1 hypothetical protein D7033_24425 [Aquimarina sp. AD10]
MDNLNAFSVTEMKIQETSKTLGGNVPSILTIFHGLNPFDIYVSDLDYKPFDWVNTGAGMQNISL